MGYAPPEAVSASPLIYRQNPGPWPIMIVSGQASSAAAMFSAVPPYHSSQYTVSPVCSSGR